MVTTDTFTNKIIEGHLRKQSDLRDHVFMNRKTSLKKQFFQN